MDDMQRLIYSVIQFVLFGGTTYFMLNTCFKSKKMDFVQWIMKIVLFPALFLLSMLIKNDIVMGVIQFCIVWLVAQFLYEAKKTEILLFLFVEQFVYLICPMVCFSALTWIADDQICQMILEEKSFFYSVSMLIFIYVFAFAVMYLMMRLLFDPNRDWPIYQEVYFIAAVILCVICLLVNIQLLSETSLNDPKKIYQSSILPVVLFLFFISDILYSEKYYRLKLQMEKRDLFDHFASKQNEYYNKLQEQQREIRKLNHDMKNHLLVLQDQKEGNENYRKELLLKLDEKMQYMDTGNGLADIIFYEKKKEAAKNHIMMSIGVEEGILKAIPEVELCTILTNALDNAIEACSRLTGNRKIQMKGTKVAAGIVLVIENTCKETPNIENGKIRTSKADKKNHGFGLENITQAVEDLKGSMDICFEDGMFRLSILLPGGN